MSVVKLPWVKLITRENNRYNDFNEWSVTLYPYKLMIYVGADGSFHGSITNVATRTTSKHQLDAKTTRDVMVEMEAIFLDLA